MNEYECTGCGTAIADGEFCECDKCGETWCEPCFRETDPLCPTCVPPDEDEEDDEDA